MSPRALASSRRTALAVTLLLGALLGGCVTNVAKPGLAPSPPVAESTARAAVSQWQAHLARFVAEGGGDPAVLARMPALRTPAVHRPGRIVFGVNDVFAFVPERDGFDVAGLLVGRIEGPEGPRYLFVVGTVERDDYRSVAVADIRLAAMSMRDGVAAWETGFSDSEALARYRRHADPTTAVRFPADQDRFRISACPPAVCIEEDVSGARLALYPSTPATTAPRAK